MLARETPVDALPEALRCQAVGGKRDFGLHRILGESWALCGERASYLGDGFNTRCRVHHGRLRSVETYHNLLLLKLLVRELQWRWLAAPDALDVVAHAHPCPTCGGTGQVYEFIEAS